MRRRNSENTTQAMSKIPARRRPPTSKLLALKRSMLSVTFRSCTVDGARTVAGVETTGAFVAGEVAGPCCVTAFDVAGSFAGLCSVFAVEVAGLVAGLEAACVVVSGSFGNGARVSEGNAFTADGISTLGEFVVSGPGVFSFFASGCVVSIVFGRISGGACGFLFNVRAGAGIGLGSMDGGAVSFFAISFDGATGWDATFCAGWSQPT